MPRPRHVFGLAFKCVDRSLRVKGGNLFDFGFDLELKLFNDTLVTAGLAAAMPVYHSIVRKWKLGVVRLSTWQI
jgi:hypothetical protein